MPAANKPNSYHDAVRSLRAEVAYLLEQMSQMKGRFPDDDNAIQDAMDGANETIENTATFLNPVQIVIDRSGGVIHDTTGNAKGISVCLLDFEDVDGEDAEDIEIGPSGDKAFVRRSEPALDPAATEFWRKSAEQKEAASWESAPAPQRPRARQ